MSTTANVPASLEVRIAEHFAKTPNAMTLVAARELGCPEVEVVRRLPSVQGRTPVTELDASRLRQMLERLVGVGKCHVIVSNGATTMESNGKFGGFSETGEWLNVQTGDLDMHIRASQIVAAFAVEKLSHMTGDPVLSLQFFDREGAAAFKAFLNFTGKDLTEERRTAFDAIRRDFALESA